MGRTGPGLAVLRRLLGVVVMLVVSACGDTSEGPPSTGGDGDPSVEPGGRPVPVEALVIRPRRVEQRVQLAGVMRPIHSVDLVAGLQGEVRQVYGELGAAVTPMDTLAVIDDEIPWSQYRQAKAQVLSAENNLKIAELNLKSDGELLDNGDVSMLAYENSLLTVKSAEAARLSALASFSLAEAQLEDTRIVPPIPGLISRKHIDTGTMVAPGQSLYRVVDISRLKVEVGVSQSMVGRVRTGDPTVARIPALNDERFEGRVRYVSPEADEKTGAFLVEIHIENTEDHRIRAGMTARIELPLSGRTRQLVIPEYALVSKNGDDYVYRVTGRMARLVKIEADETVGSDVVVASGLAEGDTVVVVGMETLGVETKVLIESYQTR